MKKTNLFSRMLLLFALIVGSTSAWAEDVKDVITAENLTATSTTYTDFSNVSITSDAVYAGNSAKDGSGNIQLRSKNSNSGIVSTTSGGKLKSVKITVGSGSNTIDVYGSNTAYTSAANLYSTSGNNNQGTKLGSLTENGTITVSGDYAYVGIRSNNGAVYISSIEIEWEEESSTNPSITANDVPIAYNATSGSIAYSLANGEGNVTASVTSGDWLTLGSITASEVPFTCSANPGTTARTATVTLSYTGATDKVVTVTQAAAPVTYTTIPALFEAATTDGTNVNVSFGNWVVSGVSGSNAYVTDNNGNGFIIYKSNHGFAVNDKLIGTVNGTPLKLYNGSAEFTNLTTSTSGLSVSHDGEITVITNKTIADLGGVNTGAVITLSNLTYDGTNLSDGTNSIKPYTTLYSGTFENGKTYNVTGVYLQYNTTKEILPRSADDIEEVVSTEPSIDVSETSIEATAAEKEGTITVTYNYITEVNADVYFCDANGEAATYDWILAEIRSTDVTKLDYSIAENTGTEARTAYMKVYALDDEFNDVYSNLITITQAANVPTITYSLAKSITSGKHYIITDGKNKAMGEQKSNNRAAVDVAIDNEVATVSSNDVYEFVIYGPDANGFYTIYDANESSTGYLYAAGSGSGKNYLKTKADIDNNGKWDITIDIEGDGAATVVAQGNNTNNHMRFNSSLFSCYGENSSVTDLVYFYEKENEADPTEPVTVTSAKYATYSSENALNFNGTGITVYQAKADGSKVTLTEVTDGIVPAYTGVVLYSESVKENVAVPVSTTKGETTWTDNEMMPNIKRALVAQDGGNDKTNYILSNEAAGVGFYLAAENGAYLPAHRAYLSTTATTSAPFLSFDEGTTGIVNVNRETITNNQYYTLDGRRVENPSNGIYIVNGKKVVVK